MKKIWGIIKVVFVILMILQLISLAIALIFSIFIIPRMERKLVQAELMNHAIRIQQLEEKLNKTKTEYDKH